MYVFLYVCMYVCMYICTSMHLCISMHSVWFAGAELHSFFGLVLSRQKEKAFFIVLGTLSFQLLSDNAILLVVFTRRS